MGENLLNVGWYNCEEQNYHYYLLWQYEYTGIEISRENKDCFPFRNIMRARIHHSCDMHVAYNTLKYYTWVVILFCTHTFECNMTGVCMLPITHLNTTQEKVCMLHITPTEMWNKKGVDAACHILECNTREQWADVAPTEFFKAGVVLLKQRIKLREKRFQMQSIHMSALMWVRGFPKSADRIVRNTIPRCTLWESRHSSTGDGLR